MTQLRPSFVELDRQNLRQPTMVLVPLLALAASACAPPSAPGVSYPGPCTVTSTGADGVEHIIERTHFQAGLPVEREAFGLDGSPRRLWRWTRSDGITTLESTEYDAGSALRWTRKRWADDRGRWALETVDDRSDGTIDAWRAREFDGAQLRRESAYRGGERLFTTRFTPSESGQQIEELVAWEDGESDRTVRAYDRRDRMTHSHVDLGADGIWDQETATIWDGAGRVAWWEDDDADGRPNLVGTRQPAVDGYVELEDLDGDDVHDRIRRYDSAGNIAAQELPHDRVTLRYSYACF